MVSCFKLSLNLFSLGSLCLCSYVHFGYQSTLTHKQLMFSIIWIFKALAVKNKIKLTL